ncbi:MAG: YtxH domain-containing protein [Candidatus Omnitrophica bacterium]|nr:YtxH domain-containing protein [Candidatus Omnitrophota bacterium]MBI3083443.1 YtxH domain-containing protein [Candidatus Omnitrophota bacterium]
MKENRWGRGILRAVAAFSLGATAGSLLTLLYAPASGAFTRRRLVMKARSLQRNAARRFGKTQRVLATKAERVREAASGWITEHLPHRNSNGRHPVRHRKIQHATAH